jgi:16S rRNA (guanine966-N2)-methyltransferase
MFNITGGRFKGLALVTPPKVRATEAKVRQAIGNILRDVLEGARVLDGFAGSGALGCEALSRGASFVAFVDSDPDAVVSIRDNLARLGAEADRAAWRVLHLEFERGLRELAASEPPFDLVLLDPPYRTDDGKKALNALARYAILAPAGLVVVEHHQRTVLPASLGPLEQFKRHRYGDTVLSLYRVGG